MAELNVTAILKKEFDTADKANKGFISKAETKLVLERVLEFKLEERLATKVISLCDADQSGNINFDEFVTSASALVEVLMDLSAEFRKVDTDNSGFITADELGQLVIKSSSKGKTIHPDDRLIQDFISSCDKDGDGRINFSEFMFFMANELCQ